MCLKLQIHYWFLVATQCSDGQRVYLLQGKDGRVGADFGLAFPASYLVHRSWQKHKTLVYFRFPQQMANLVPLVPVPFKLSLGLVSHTLSNMDSYNSWLKQLRIQTMDRLRYSRWLDPNTMPSHLQLSAKQMKDLLLLIDLHCHQIYLSVGDPGDHMYCLYCRVNYDYILFGQYPVPYQDTITLKDPPQICSYLLLDSAFLSATSQLPTKPTVCITDAINWDKNAADLLKTENDSEDKGVRKEMEGSSGESCKRVLFGSNERFKVSE